MSAGGDPKALGEGVAYLRATQIRAFIEVYIEQGPMLEAAGRPIGLVKGIRGAFRYRFAQCIGEYGHSGTVPRDLRHDSVSATAALIGRLNDMWRKLEADDHDLAVTVGSLSTDSTMHAVSKIAGLVRFSLEARSVSAGTLRLVRGEIDRAAMAVQDEYRVRFNLGEPSCAPPAALDARLHARLHEIADEMSIPLVSMISGAGHDSAVFSNAAIPAALIFVRNGHGSHNPDESMALEDLLVATRLLTEVLLRDP